ncbi:N-acetylglucosamine-6-phosphate deacetylase [Synergistales bacterium]|nr:N-acetylglucosamine-6-phosphate deacetylase [Synergistales bacterium]
MERLLIKNAKIITQNLIVDGSLLALNGRVAALGVHIEADVDSEIDAKGLFLSPGFIDIHNHGRMGFDVMDASVSSLLNIAIEQIKHGVTGFLATTNTAEKGVLWRAVNVAAEFCDVDRQAERTANKPRRGAQCLGIYVEGNHISMKKRGSHPPELLRPIAQENLNTLLSAGKGNIRVMAFAPELPGSLDAIRRLRHASVVAAAAHTDATFDEAMDGINAGVTLAAHTFNSMRAMTHRDPSIIAACLLDDRVVCEAIADGTHLDPAILQLIYRLKGPDRVCLISDSVRYNGLPDGQYNRDDGRDVTVKNGVIRLGDGRLAGSSLSMNEAVRNMVRLAGIPLFHAVRMASFVPSRVIGMDAAKGSLDVGKDADMILFDEDVNVEAAFIGGKRII